MDQNTEGDSIPTPSFIGGYSPTNYKLYLTIRSLSLTHVTKLTHFLTHAPNHITQLDLSSAGIMDDHIRLLLPIFNHPNLSIQHLNLSQNCISTEGARFLATTLSMNTTIHTLDLNHNLFGDEGVKAFIHNFACNSTLRTLDLGTNSISGEGVKYLSEILNTSITKLTLSWNQFGDEGAMYLANLLSFTSSLCYLVIQFCGIKERGCEEICRVVGEKNTSLLFLCCGSGNRVNDRCMDFLSKNSYLVFYHLKIYNKHKSPSEFLERNTRRWRERMKWGCMLNYLYRVMILGGECEILPLEMVYHILGNVLPVGLLKEDEVKRIERVSSDISTLGKARRDFLEVVFGKLISMHMLFVKKGRVATKSSQLGDLKFI